jgi:phosphinothricin acetyltransferase
VKPRIVLASANDLPAILRLANLAAETTAANFATEPEPLDEWQRAWTDTREMYPWLVTRDGGSVVGFAKASPHRSRGAYRWTAEVTVYVEPELHGRRLGSALYGALVPLLREQGYVTLLAGITTPNPASERLHAAFGFARCGIHRRAGWKFGRWHDVGYWELHLSPEGRAPEPIRRVAQVWQGYDEMRTP